jgi:hypothetical protein
MVACDCKKYPSLKRKQRLTNSFAYASGSDGLHHARNTWKLNSGVLRRWIDAAISPRNLA